MKIYQIQPAAYTDNMWLIDGEMETGSKLPYPFDVKENGDIWNQTFWRGTPKRVMGFCNTPEPGSIDLWWRDALTDPQSMVNKYVVTQDEGGGMSVHQTAIQSVKVLDLPDDAADE